MTEEQEKYSYDLNDNGDKVKWLAIEHGYSIERIAYSMGMSMNQVLKKAMKTRVPNTVRKPKVNR